MPKPIHRGDHLIESTRLPGGHVVSITFLADGTFACRHFDADGSVVASINIPCPPDRWGGNAGEAFLWKDAEVFKVTGLNSGWERRKDRSE